MTIWRVPKSVPASDQGLKYSLLYGRPGQRLVGYDNESGKGDHRHFGGKQSPYRFKTVEQLVEDFFADLRQVRVNK